MSADLIRRLVEAGAPADLIADVAMALASAAATEASLERRRESERNRKSRARADVTGCHVTSADGAEIRGPLTPLDVPPFPSPRPLTKTPPLSPQPDNNRARATRLADGFVVPPEWIAWAISDRRWARLDADEEAAMFIDFWHAKAGKDGAKLDWQATWRNWCRNSRRQSGRASPRAPPVGSIEATAPAL